MRNPRRLIVFAVVAVISLVIGFGCWYWQFTKDVDAMTSITLPTFESGFSK